MSKDPDKPKSFTNILTRRTLKFNISQLLLKPKQVLIQYLLNQQPISKPAYAVKSDDSEPNSPEHYRNKTRSLEKPNILEKPKPTS